MDDALVNFDDSRALAAARVLVEFVADQPQERQMLLLTCHAHVAKLFAEVGAHVRSLSDPTATWLPQPKPQRIPREPKMRTVRIAPSSEPVEALVTEPVEVRTVTTDGDRPMWEAEDYFFGSGRPKTTVGDDESRRSQSGRPHQGRRRRGPKRA
jgi:hypothetical protein